MKRASRAAGWGTLLALLVLGTSRVPRAEEAVRPVPLPLAGIAGVDPFNPAHADPRLVAGLELPWSTLVKTVPIAWGRIVPHPPVMGGRHLHDWEALDRFVTIWQKHGFEPVLVLSPASPWAAAPAGGTHWELLVRKELPAPDAEALLAQGVGASPPGTPQAWRHWETFVQDVLERYDGDGVDDAPALSRPLRWIQILDSPARPESFAGSIEDYLRLLHHAGLALEKSEATTRIAAGHLDLDGLARPPLPDDRVLDRRLADRMRQAPAATAFAARRHLDFVRRALEIPGIFHAVGHGGAAHAGDEDEGVRFLRRRLDDASADLAEVWLGEAPSPRIGAPRGGHPGAPSAEERRVRSRWLATARRPGHGDRPLALAWRDRGRAYEVVRTLCAAREAGAFRVFVGDRGEGGGLAAFGRVDAHGTLRRAASWFALRQALARISGHDGVSSEPLGSPWARAYRFSFPERDERPWVAVLVLHPDVTWAGDPKGETATRAVTLAVPAGTYIVEDTVIDGAEPKRERVRVDGGLIRLILGPAPRYLYPDY